MREGLGPTHGSPADGAGLRVRALQKTYPGTQALASVTFKARAGAIHGLVGGNGSGKSTLVKILSGVEQADTGGTVAVGDTEIAADAITPVWAAVAGVRVVHQDLGLFGNLSVAENLFAGQKPPRSQGRIAWGDVNRLSAAMLERVGVDADPEDRLETLRASDQTLVAVARAMDDRRDGPPSLLILDEPTARLPAAESDRLLEALRRLAGRGVTSLYISHHLDEVLALCDDVTVLRDGSLVATRPAARLDVDTLAELMVGRAFQQATRPDRRVTGQPVLRVHGLAAGRLRDVDLEIHAGEVVGVVGLVGSGRSQLLQAIFGARLREAGLVEVAGNAVRAGDIGAAMRAGLALIPEDRVTEGIFLNLGIPENVSASFTRRYWSRGFLRHRRERRAAAEAIDRFGIRAPAVDAHLNALSGGNQQKVVVARWLAMDPLVLLLDEPTQGVDIAARADIHAQFDAAVASGCAVLLVTSDVDEMERLADRVVFLAGGRITDQGARALDLEGARS